MDKHNWKGEITFDAGELADMIKVVKVNFDITYTKG
jgi:hypothetical protein